MNVAMPWIEHLMEDEGLSYPAARRLFDQYPEAIPVVIEGVHVGTFIKNNAEIHFALFKEFRGHRIVSRKNLRAYLKPMLDKECFLTTKLGEKDDDSFIRRLGFNQIGTSSSGQRIYMLLEIPLLEKKK